MVDGHEATERSKFFFLAEAYEFRGFLKRMFD